MEPVTDAKNAGQMFEGVSVSRAEKSDNMERIGFASDTLENLVAALSLPLPPTMHIQALKETLPEMVKILREVFVSETNDNPWDDA